MLFCAELVAKRRESKVLQGLKEMQKANDFFGAPCVCDSPPCVLRLMVMCPMTHCHVQTQYVPALRCFGLEAAN